ncbi:MAG TPA: hypothetical protein VEJ41_05710 [Candidatus Acidoferrales bacterium]|nr:hypothetical protein [Candidatus Acidoferrales bacterium]
MTILRRIPTLLALAVICAACLAGRAAAIEHATTPIDDETRNTLIPTGTLIRVTMLQTVTSAHCSKGQTFNFKVLDDVKAGDRVAIPAGTTGTGKVVECKPAHGGREDGMLHIEFDPLVLPDSTQVTVGITHDSLVADANQKNGTGPALEDIANMMVPGFFIIDFLRKGDNVTIAAGSPFHIAVTEDAFLSE